jgi:LmbE family N-acetylglucosaminyl deacetylase
MSTQSSPIKRLALLAIFAHPDDESLVMGGTLARYARAGVEVSIVCATRGEWGLISEPALAIRENLAHVRESELRAACGVLGVSHLHFLDCPDGDVNHTYWPEVEEQIVRYIRQLRPDVIVTFGPDGLYGHPDHIAVSMLATAAFKSAGEDCRFPQQVEQGLQPHQASKLYYAQLSQKLFIELYEALSAEHGAPQLWGFDANSFGVPEELITTTIDVADHVLTKLQALRCHQTQLAQDNMFSLIGEATARRFLAREHFRLASSKVPLGFVERDLFEGLTNGQDVGGSQSDIPTGPREVPVV